MTTPRPTPRESGIPAHPAVLAAAVLALLSMAPGEAAAAAPPVAPADIAADTLRDLRAVVDTGVVLRDGNGDGVVDRVAVRILLPPEAGEAEAVAAANLAARLGYETVASDLRPTANAAARPRHAVPVIVVGSRALEALDIGDPEELTAALAPGQGVVAHLPARGALGAGGVAVVGYDASGLLDAAAYLAGRAPAVWAPDGTTWREVAEGVERYARGHRWLDSGSGTPSDTAGPAPEVRLDRVVVTGDAPGVERARVTVTLPDAGAVRRAAASLEPTDSASEGEGASTAGTDADTVPAPPDRSTLEYDGLRRVDVRLVAPDTTATVTVVPGEPRPAREGDAYRPGSVSDLSLDALYSIDGLYRDTNRDLVPDETVGWLSVRGASAPDALAAWATRIGLETAGIRLPLARVAGREEPLDRWGLPVLVGADHDRVLRLRAEGRLATPPPGPGTGFVEVVDDGAEDGPAVVVAGGDAAGERAALEWLALRAPYLHTHGKGEVGLEELRTEVRRVLQAREGPGQVALALAKLETWMRRRAEADTLADPARVEVELAARDAPAGLGALAAGIVRERFPDAQVEVETFATDYGQGDTIFVQEWEIPWEVEEVRETLDAEVYPDVRAGEPARVEVRVSEPPEVREALAAEIRGELAARGAEPVEVRVVTAYKQGYSWLVDHVLPRLRDTDVASVELTYHTLEESEEVRWQTIAADTRWLQEVYPFDAVFARELSIPDSAVTFRPTREPEPVYTVVARDSAGAVVLRESFDPRYVVRPFFDLFPEYEQVRVTTGWVTATVGGDRGDSLFPAGADTVVDRRVVTDPERFWDRLQTETYDRIVEYVMDTQDGDPSPSNAPYFDALRVDLRLSEPDHRIGIDEEVVSSLEALHEDIYFETLTLFDLIAARYQTSLPYPGRVLPYMDPGGAGEPGRARIVFTGKERAGAEVVVRTWDAPDAEPLLTSYALTPLPLDAPRVSGVTVEAGAPDLSRVAFRLTLPDSVDRYEEFRERSSEAAIDRQFTSVELVEGMLAAVRRLHGAGLMEEVLAWDRVGEVAVDLRAEEDSTFRRVAVVPRSGNPASTTPPRLVTTAWDPPSAAGGEPDLRDRWSPDADDLVQWETPIPPAEADSVMAKLGTVDGFHVYPVAESYLGRTVWALDVLPPHGGRYLSQAKLNALKPTLFLSGRQHANEVSSTSHILRLAELLATDSTYRAWLDDVNVVLHPVANPDGAELAVEMQETTPDFMLHAGYLGALGVDMTAGERSDDPVYPESQARRRIREAWLPDVYVNMHGYPSHEWVQYFAGYSAWVRSRRGGARDWWAPRGWFIPGYSWVDDEEHPEYREAQFAALDAIAASITSLPEVEAMNRRMYGRYRKYGTQDRDEFREHLHEGILVHLRLRGAESIGTGVYSPRITYVAVTTEAPDETARGDWLDLVATAGIAHSTALLRYLAEGTFEVEREAEGFEGGVVARKVYRVKPVLPPEEDGAGPP